ncbi:hypothetical protein OH77DRAFT_505313 [Trametes cingulata]|nr:hypothetical protein OH77DRAFT_505313 [Trametes cingulata]
MEPLTRAEVLKTLACMGVELPANTRLPDDTLEKRLRAALDAAQEKGRFPDPLDLQSLPAWPLLTPLGGAPPPGGEGRPLLDAVKRGNMQEARETHLARLAGASPHRELYVDPFMDLRQTVMSMANVLDQGIDWCIVQDPAQEAHAINIRFLHVYELDPKTPAVLLLYRAFSRSDAPEGARWYHHQAYANPRARAPGRSTPAGSVGITIKATPLEQKVLLKLLGANARLLPPDFRAEAHRQAHEARFRASVLLPVGPLGFDAVGRLNNIAGCAICGKRGGMRCAQCQSAAYCSPECQKLDWPAHKPVCRSLKGGRWTTVAFRTHAPGTEGMHTALINRYTNVSRASDILSSLAADPRAPPPPDVHGARPFLAKLQVGLAGPGRDTLVVYDRQRSFGHAYVARADAPAAFADLLAEMAGPRGGYGGVKMYRWVRRVGEWELAVCVDRSPDMEVKW